MYNHLTSQQRYAISTFIQNGWSRAKIADSIGVNHSTVTREINRNSGVRGTYNWETAQKNADYRKILLSGKSKQKALYLFIHRYCSRFTHPEAWFSVSNCKYYRMHLF